MVFTWDAVDGATSYKVWSSTDPYAPFPEGWTCETITSDTEHIEEVTGQKKYFRVVGINDN